MRVLTDQTKALVAKVKATRLDYRQATNILSTHLDEDRSTGTEMVDVGDWVCGLSDVGALKVKSWVVRWISVNGEVLIVEDPSSDEPAFQRFMKVQSSELWLVKKGNTDG